MRCTRPKTAVKQKPGYELAALLNGGKRAPSVSLQPDHSPR